jgi:tRNA 2-selenouridine synthase SelU
VLPNKKTREEKLDRFLEDQNVLLYRRLRNSSTGETERRAIMKLLADVWDDFKYQLQQDKLGKSVRESKPVKRWH